jgi:hypothetical protein
MFESLERAEETESARPGKRVIGPLLAKESARHLARSWVTAGVDDFSTGSPRQTSVVVERRPEYLEHVAAHARTPLPRVARFIAAAD